MKNPKEKFILNLVKKIESLQKKQENPAEILKDATAAVLSRYKNVNAEKFEEVWTREAIRSGSIDELVFRVFCEVGYTNEEFVNLDKTLHWEIALVLATRENN